MIVDHDAVERQAGGLRRRSLDPRQSLAADPDFAAVLADMDGAVHRLHRGVRQERKLIGRLDLGDGAGQSCVHIADVLRHRTRMKRRLFERGHDAVHVQRGMRTVVPFDLEGLEPLLRRPHVIRDDGDGIVEVHDLAHAVDRLGGRIVHALHAPAEDGRLRQRRDLHARRPRIDAVDGGTVHLPGKIQALGRHADQRELLGPLELDMVGNGHRSRRRRPIRRKWAAARSARAAPRRSARDTKQDRRSSVWRPPRSTSSWRSRPPLAAAATPNAPRSNCRSPAPRPARDCRRAWRSAARAQVGLDSSATSSSSAISIGIAV